jgi:hypothetical protein
MLLAQELAQQVVGKGVGGGLLVGAVIIWLTSMGGKR